MRISKMKATSHVRRSRRVRSRLTRALALAVVGPLITGSLAYAAGVGPVRRRVDEFLKGTARLFDKAGSSTGEFHLSPNPAGQGVLVMPVDDRGPRPGSENAGQDSGKKKEEKSSPKAHDPKEKSAPTTAAKSKEQKADSGSRQPNKPKSETSPNDANVSDSGTGSGEVGEASEQGWSESDDDSGAGSGDSGGGSSGSDSGSGDSDEDNSASSGESGSGSEDD